MHLAIADRFNQELPADPESTNARRPVVSSAFSFVTPRIPSQPRLLHASPDVARLIGLSPEDIHDPAFLEVFSGARVPEGAHPYAMCYGGHQFGNWAGQLGDGRAINLAEVRHDDHTWMLQLKGAGETPYSRTADGLAVLRSSLREHLCSEAMHHLGIATTRSLALIATGDQVMRDMLYNGNAAFEPGAVVCRVAPSFIRFGSFEIFAARDDTSLLRQLADYTIRHHFPGIEQGTPAGYSAFFRSVCERTLDMILHWQRVGFVHGVMNTDNMSIHGDTIDYGPYGWLEGYDPDWTPNTTDAAHGRYRFGQQPSIALWNLVQLANALYPLIQQTSPLEEALHAYQDAFQQRYLEMRAAKIGLERVQSGDEGLLEDLETALQATETDMTLFYRLLAELKLEPGEQTVPDERLVHEAFYQPEEVQGEVLATWQAWFSRYRARLAHNASSDQQRADTMNRVNPRYVLRNYMAQLAIDKATDGDPSLIEEFYHLLRAPYTEQPEFEQWFAKRPDWARHKVGCSMLSCSS